MIEHKTAQSSLHKSFLLRTDINMEENNDQAKSVMASQEATPDQHVVQKEESGAIPARPKLSPYASPFMAVHFGDGPPLYVHSQLITAIPKLSSLRGNKIVPMGHIPSGAGHVLIHYLFTGTYESLGPRSSSYAKKDATEFATSARVYGIARDYELTGLEALAKSEMEKLGNRLAVMDVLDALNNITPRLSTDDVWLQNFLKSLIQPFIDNPPTLLDGLSNSPGRALSITNALLKVVLELWSDKLASGWCSSDVPESRHNEPAAPQLDAACEPAIGPENNMPNALKYSPSHQAYDGMPNKIKKGKKQRPEVDGKTGLPWRVNPEVELARIKNEQPMNTQDKIDDWASTASTTTTYMSKRALKRLNRAQQNCAVGNHHGPEPTPQPFNMIGCTIDPRLLPPGH